MEGCGGLYIGEREGRRRSKTVHRTAGAIEAVAVVHMKKARKVRLNAEDFMLLCGVDAGVFFFF